MDLYFDVLFQYYTFNNMEATSAVYIKVKKSDLWHGLSRFPLIISFVSLIRIHRTTINRVNALIKIYS